jgi:ATP-dependent exoDNAse (exonuclease V) beta subunit
LKTNWRSSSNIINFNNALFSIIPEQLDLAATPETPDLSFNRLYSEAVQYDTGRKTGGYVRLEFVEDEMEEVEEGGINKKKLSRKWNCKVLDKLPEIIELFQDNGYNASDIGILVRDGREGSSVIRTLIDYSNSCPPEKKHKYN